MTAPIVVLDELADRAAVDAMVDLAVGFGSYRGYAEYERVTTPVGEGLSPRHDALANFLRSGADEGRAELAARTAYFREEYAYGAEVRAAGIEQFLHHRALLDAARRVHGQPLVEPVIAYANLMVPGQQLAVHTDVPEFRGVNRKVVPQWLLVVMHHSGLFDAWRLPIATGIAWFSDAPGGGLRYWPDGPTGASVVHPAPAGAAMVLDTDTVFHGVERVGPPGAPAPPVDARSTLAAGGRDTWVVRDELGTETARYGRDEVRLSVSWKAYCFPDDAARDAWRDHRDDLTEDEVLDRLVADLRARGAVDGEPARDRDLGLLLIDTYVRFPAA